MEIVVLAKSVPEVAEAELAIDDAGNALDAEDLVFGINEWDNFAVEEAIRLKEAHGGSVTVITLGPEEAEDILRRALAMGADAGIHLCDQAFAGSDPATVARLFARVLGDRKMDLVLAGVQSSDENNAQTAVLLAQELGWAYATVATRIARTDDGLSVRRELESDVEELVEVPLPAVITVQSGINQPRYVSVMGIRQARAKPIEAIDLDALGSDAREVGAAGSTIARRTLSLPAVTRTAELLEGSLAEVTTRLAAIVREKGGLS